MNKQEYYDWLERKRLVAQAPSPRKDSGLDQANYMIKRTMEIFNMVQTVKVCSENDFLEYFSQFPKDEAGCKEWVKGQRFREKYVEASPRSKDSFLKIGRFAKEYFGAELVKKCWHHKEPVQEKASIQDQIKQAKAIEGMSRDKFLEQLEKARAIERS